MDIKKAQETLTEARLRAVLRSDYAARDEILDVQIWVHELAEREKALTEACELLLDSHRTSSLSNGAIRRAEDAARAALALHKEDA